MGRKPGVERRKPTGQFGPRFSTQQYYISVRLSCTHATFLTYSVLLQFRRSVLQKITPWF